MTKFDKKRGDIAFALAQGWKYVGRYRGHYKFKYPGSNLPLTLGSTPSDWRSIANAKTTIKYMTLQVQGDR